MPSCLAVAWALDRSRDAIAVTSQSALRCMAGSTFATPILAVLRTPQRILVMICSFAGYPAVHCYYTGSKSIFFLALLVLPCGWNISRRRTYTVLQGLRGSPPG